VDPPGQNVPPAEPGTRMQKKMGEAVARVARKVNDTVENKTDSLGKPGAPARLPLGAWRRIGYPGAVVYFLLPWSKKSCLVLLLGAAPEASTPLGKGKTPPKGSQPPRSLSGFPAMALNPVGRAPGIKSFLASDGGSQTSLHIALSGLWFSAISLFPANI